MQLYGNLNILWHCLSLGLKWKLTLCSPVATAEFSKFAHILSAVLSQHHFLGFEIAQLEFRRRQWHPTPVRLPGKSHGWRSLEGCSPWGRWGSDTTERLHFHFSLSCIGEGNGSPLWWSCLENPKDGAAWWAAVYGVTQSQTRLKWLSNSSSNWNSITSTSFVHSNAS